MEERLERLSDAHRLATEFMRLPLQHHHVFRRSAAARSGEEGLAASFQRFEQRHQLRGRRQRRDRLLLQWARWRVRRSKTGVSLLSAATMVEKVERAMEESGRPLRSALTRATRRAWMRIGGIVQRKPNAPPAQVEEVGAVLEKLLRRRDRQAAALVAATWGTRCRMGDLRALMPADVQTVREYGTTGYRIRLRQKPDRYGRRPPVDLVAGPCADVFGDWLRFACARGCGLFGPDRSEYRAVVRRVLAVAPGWKAPSLRRGSLQELERDQELQPEDIVSLARHSSLEMTQLYINNSTRAVRARLRRQLRRLEPAGLRQAVGRGRVAARR